MANKNRRINGKTGQELAQAFDDSILSSIKILSLYFELIEQGKVEPSIPEIMAIVNGINQTVQNATTHPIYQEYKRSG